MLGVIPWGQGSPVQFLVGHMPGLREVPSWGVCNGWCGDQLMFLSYINVSLPLSSSLPFSLKIKIKINK